MKLSEILRAVSKIDGRRKLSNEVDLKASLFRVTDDGKYELHVSCYFPAPEIEKVIENVLANLKRFGVKKFNAGSRGDGSVDKVTLMKFCKKFVLEEWHLSIFVVIE